MGKQLVVFSLRWVLISLRVFGLRRAYSGLVFMIRGRRQVRFLLRTHIVAYQYSPQTNSRRVIAASHTADLGLFMLIVNGLHGLSGAQACSRD